jgi:hypothetical protein
VKSPQRCENATVSEWRGDKVGNLTDIKGQWTGGGSLSHVHEC